MIASTPTEILLNHIILFCNTIGPIMAGVWSSLGSTFGKLSGSPDVVGDSYILWGLLLILMVIVNTWGCRCYLMALDEATNTVTPTVISSASSFMLSAIIDKLVFNGESTLQWWIGTLLIVQGIALVARQRKHTNLYITNDN